MRRPRIYSDSSLELGKTFELDDRSDHYLRHVLRIKSGQSITVFNGDGNDYHATVTEIKRKVIQVTLNDTETSIYPCKESPIDITLAIGISKGDRMDWVVQKATELGVNKIQPLLTHRVDKPFNESRLKKKTEHWQAVAISACEQCGRSVIPQLANAITTNDWLSESRDTLKLVLDPNGKTLKTLNSQLDSPPKDIDLLVGPEGGLTQEEIEHALKENYFSLSLGPRILRTETAPLVAMTLIQERWGDI